uniref:Nuclear Hormone Receptor family n=1 Tax=Caenorhabditis tropicalis TaxID=1561998 RepID=A0A1I7TAQ1_9PELO
MSKSLLTVNFSFCKVCGQPAAGNHFGIPSCRACAAFFRRAANSKWGSKPCKSLNCDRKLIPCKPCRLKRCQEQGMSTNNFQFNRDVLKRILPRSVEIFVGKPESVIFCDPSQSTAKTYIDIQNLIDNISKILKTGAEGPVTGKNQLQKLSNGLETFSSQISVRVMKTMSKDETADCWEYYLTTTAKWLNYFDEFKLLSDELQLKIALSMWHVWGRLEKHAVTALVRKQKLFTDRHIIVVGRNVLVTFESFEYDHTWLTKYPPEQVEFFTGVKSLELYEAVDYLIELEPTQMELTYMLAQLSFQYVGQRFQGEILNVTERFQQILSDDLHEYYVKEIDKPRYSERLAKMIKINNIIQKYVRDIRPRADLARTFDIFSVEFSHPEVFHDTGF